MPTHMDDVHLKEAIAVARQSLGDGDGPFGAVLAVGSETLAVGRNRTVAEKNPLVHAEIVAIREACTVHGQDKVKGSTLYSSCEPCPMCIAAAHYAQVARVVFGATLQDAREYGSGDPPADASKVIICCGLDVELIAGERREEAVELFRAYVEKFGHL